MKAYFDAQSWYKGTDNDVNALLTDIERSNVDLIKTYEK